MRTQSILLRALAPAGVLLAVLGTSASAAENASAETGPVQAVWKPVEIRYSYTGFTTAYNCDAFESKVRNILTRLGAPAQTRVSARGCTDLNRPTRNFFVDITTAAAVPTQDGTRPADSAHDELLKRLGGKQALSRDPFPATWKTFDLSREAAFDLRPGDCELMQGLRDEVLPKLSMKVVSERVHCTPNQLPIQTPQLTVSALVPLEAPDAARPPR